MKDIPNPPTRLSGPRPRDLQTTTRRSRRKVVRNQSLVNRQLIMVTHNIDLAIGSDADRVSIADSEPHSAGGLAPTSHAADGLRMPRFASRCATYLWESRDARITCAVPSCAIGEVVVVKTIQSENFRGSK